jgi:hypothetical protein
MSTTTTMRIVVAVASLLHLLVGSQAYVAISDGLVCDTIPTDPSFEVCAISYQEGPSPAVMEGADNTTVMTYVGNYIHDFLLYASFEGAEGTPQLEVEKQHHVGFNVRVERNGTSNECLVVAVNKNACNSCTYCASSETDGDTYSADCTNLPMGRNVTCESTLNVFFPLTAEALEKEEEEEEEKPVDTPPVDTTTATPAAGGTDQKDDTAASGADQKDDTAASGATARGWAMAALLPTVVSILL